MRVYLLLLFFSISANAELIDRIVATVNNEIITESDLKEFKKRLKSQQIQDDLFDIDAKKIQGSREKMISHIIDEKIVDSEIKRKKLETTIERVEEEIRNIQRRNNISREQLIQALKEQGTNLSDYQFFIKKRLERQNLVQQAITSKIKISDSDVASFYAKNTNQTSAQVYSFKISHIIFKKENGGESEAKARAEDARNQLKYGADFSQLAAQKSEDPDFSAGGLLGTFKQGEMNKKIEKAIRSLESGQFSDIIDLGPQFHIFYVNEKSLVSDPRLEAQKEQIRAFLLQEAFKKQFRFWLDQKRREAVIRVNG